jgi:prepilin-type N-terminal cleavage/methylation domain-containing protein
MKKTGFTLIELLIVVAIIGILAAIASINLLKAQTRAKTARVYSEINTLILGLEMYHVDNSAYPLDFNAWFSGPNNDYDTWIILTTPVSYLSSVYYTPWLAKNFHHNPYDENRDVYIYGGGPPVPGDIRLENMDRLNREVNIYYTIQCAGPDLDADYLWNPEDALPLMDKKINYLYLIYEPTNGTISSGDILATNKGAYR